MSEGRENQVRLDTELLDELRECARRHNAEVGSLIEHVLREYVRLERVAELRFRSGDGDRDFTSWREQLDFLHRRARGGEDEDPQLATEGT
ncbi:MULTISPECIES: hypothetical protein [unclassified Corynebacterium]|uniref:hypothetical protein n=1 Tax=unclassified Corynebacterium TaxID=2624378 RepID=UPI0035262B71